MKHEGLYYAKHCATHGDYDDRAQVCPKCVPERGFPSPASPAVGGEEEPHASSHDTKHDTSMMSAEEEAKKYAHQKCEEFLAAHGSLPYGFHGFAKGIYLAGVLRERERSKAEVERLRSGLSMAAMLDAGVPHALLMKDYREAVLQMNEERHEVAKVARALLAAGEKAGGGNV